MAMGAPCMECENRGCGDFHDKCEKYRAFREERITISRERQKLSGEWTPRRPYQHHENTPTKCHKK